MPGATAVQPDISLGVTTPPQGGNALNPMSLLNTLSEVQLRVNQNQLFQQEFGAKQTAGQILASAPDLETGLAQLYKNPATAAFAGPIANSVRQTQLTQLQMGGEQQKQANTALEALMHSLGPAMQDPSQLEPLINANLATVSQQVQPQVRAAIGSIVQALGEGNPTPAQYQSRMAGLMLGSGWNPDSIRAMTGTVAPGVSFQPMGPGGATVPVTVGGPVTGGGANVPVGIAGGAQGAPNALVPNGVASPSPASPSLAQQQFLSDRGKQMAQYATELDDSVKTGNVLMQTLQEAREAEGGFKPGGGAGTYARIGQIAQAFGAPNDLVDRISNGDLSASQEFSKIANNFVMGQLRQSLQGIGGSRINQQEFEAFTKNNPNLETDPRAIDKIFQFWTRQHNYNLAEQQALAGAMHQPGFDITTWPAQWQRMAQQQGMVNMNVPEAGGQRPAAPVGATHQWVPGKGLVPIGPSAAPAPSGGPSTAGSSDLP